MNAKTEQIMKNENVHHTKGMEIGIHGTISHGTMRAQDLIPCFLSVLRAWDPKKSEEISERIPHIHLVDSFGHINDNHKWWDSEEPCWILEELFDALDSIAPEGMHFASHPGDGCDYGFWPNSWYDEDYA